MNTTDMNSHSRDDALEKLHVGVMGAIRKGSLRMRPRWQFICLSAAWILATMLIFLCILFFASLVVFVLRDSGAWSAPALGGRGWRSFLNGVPWLILLLSAAAVLLLALAVRHYEFAYRRPAILSVTFLFGCAVCGAFIIAATPFHHQMKRFASRDELPFPLSIAYSITSRSRSADIYHGTVIGIVPGYVTIVDENGFGTTTAHIGKRTRLPYGGDFSVGERVVIVGDRGASSTVEAFGVVESDE